MGVVAFIGGIVDSALTEVASAESEYDLSEFKGKSDSFIAAYSALRRIGLPEAASIHVAELATAEGRDGKSPTGFLSDLISDRLSSVLAFVAVFGIVFILLAIICAVIGNLIGFIFSLPGLKLLDSIAGVIFGLAKGLLIVLALAAIARYAGLLAPEAFDGTTILKHIMNNNPIADRIGI